MKVVASFLVVQKNRNHFAIEGIAHRHDDLMVLQTVPNACTSIPDRQLMNDKEYRL